VLLLIVSGRDAAEAPVAIALSTAKNTALTAMICLESVTADVEGSRAI
jgi:hypothetical protein